MSEEPYEGAAVAAAAAEPVPEENGVSDNPQVDCSSQDDPPEPVKEDVEPPGMGGQIKVKVCTLVLAFLVLGRSTFFPTYTEISATLSLPKQNWAVSGTSKI